MGHRVYVVHFEGATLVLLSSPSRAVVSCLLIHGRWYFLFAGLVEMLITLCESPLSVVMTAGDVGKWRDTPDAEKRLLLGRRLAQVHNI